MFEWWYLFLHNAWVFFMSLMFMLIIAIIVIGAYVSSKQ